MARIDLVVLAMALALLLSMQMVVSLDPAQTEAKDIRRANVKEDEKETAKEVKKDIADGLRDAKHKGIVKDKSDNFNPSASPKRQEEYLMKIFFEALTKMADEGRVDPKVLKEKLFPGGGDTMDPKIESKVFKALRDALSETKKVEDGTAVRTKPAP
ncbi:hypothetical protein V6N13_129411 [Hibiscus sabdariffa]|uniref:Uncharacterized protein n=1 Tax=Hibiscus sabdariffa TaxID=183260 RepID=A0ABR2SLY9_9ROSI